MEISHLRKEYQLFKLNMNAIRKDPLEQLKKWMQDAIDYKIVEPNAMVLSTADKSGKPSARVVLLKEIDPKGLVFYTNIESKKARDLAENPFASATFFWKELERQASFSGRIQMVPKMQAESYFQSRPRESQISAWASKQGRVASSRNEIQKAFAKEEERWKGRLIPMPPYWGGYILIPKDATFWQGREKRLHDRFFYKKSKNKWDIVRLYP